MNLYNIYTRNENGEIKMTNRFMRISDYHRRGIYRHISSNPIRTAPICWMSESGASEGVARAPGAY